MIGRIDSDRSSGTLALLNGETVVALSDMPTFDVVCGKAKRRDLDGQCPPTVGCLPRLSDAITLSVGAHD
jgi:hypothetical protein